MSKLKPLPSDTFATQLMEKGATWYFVEGQKPKETVDGDVLFKKVRLQTFVLPDGQTFSREH